MPERPQSDPLAEKSSRVEIYWTTVTYKTVAMWLIIAFVILMGALYLIFPDWVVSRVRSISKTIGVTNQSEAPENSNQARFVVIDGKVEVKKVSSVNWQVADHRTPLDKGDLIRTGADGAARISFPDGTTYTIKPDTIVTVEENRTGKNAPSQVTMEMSTGAVDLATPQWSVPGSSASVKFAGDAQAVLEANSRANVKSDPKTDQHEFTVAQGGGNVVRGDERVHVGQYERASFAQESPITISNVLAPPELTKPINLQPIIVSDPRSTPIHFEWKAVPDASSYLIRLSSSAMFSNVLTQRRSSQPAADITGLNAGDYFWSVIAFDARDNASEPSQPSKFTLAALGRTQEMLLEVDESRLHGNVVEVIGHTEPGAALIINGQAVASIQPDGHFRHFTQPMDPGSHSIVITGQNRRGGTATKRVEIVIPRP